MEEYCFVSLEENKKIRIYDEREGHHDKNLGFINLVMETFSHFLSTSPICWSLDVHSMAPSIVQFCQSHKAIHLIKFEKFQISSHPNDNIYFFFFVLIWREKNVPCLCTFHSRWQWGNALLCPSMWPSSDLFTEMNKKGKINFTIFPYFNNLKLVNKTRENKRCTFWLMYALSGSATIGERVPS